MKWGMVMKPWYVANHEGGMEELSYKGYWEFVKREREREKERGREREVKLWCNVLKRRFIKKNDDMFTKKSSITQKKKKKKHNFCHNSPCNWLWLVEKKMIKKWLGHIKITNNQLHLVM